MWRTAGKAVALLCLVALVSGGAAEAKDVAVQVEGATQDWMARTARSAAKDVLQKMGHTVVEPGAAADMTVTVTIEKAYSHHAVSPTFGLLGGVIDLWNYDNAHATVSTVVADGGREVARQTASATSRDVPLFCWAQKASRRRVAALRRAVSASLKQYVAANGGQNRTAQR